MTGPTAISARDLALVSGSASIKLPRNVKLSYWGYQLVHGVAVGAVAAAVAHAADELGLFSRMEGPNR